MPNSTNVLMDFYGNLKAVFTPEYLESSTTLALIIGIIGGIMIIVSAFLLKKSRVLGVFAGLMQVAFSYCSQKFAHLMHTMDFMQVETFYGDSQSDVDQQLDEFYSKFYEKLISDTITMSIYGIIMTASFVLTLVFVIKCLSCKPAGLFKAALALTIVKTVLIMPYDIITPFTQQVTVESATKCDTIYHVVTMLPLLLIVIGAIVVKAKKQPPQPEQPTQPDLADISAAGGN